MKQFDIVVLGGGIYGLYTALFCRNVKLPLLLLI